MRMSYPQQPPQNVASQQGASAGVFLGCPPSPSTPSVPSAPSTPAAQLLQGVAGAVPQGQYAYAGVPAAYGHQLQFQQQVPMCTPPYFCPSQAALSPSASSSSTCLTPPSHTALPALLPAAPLLQPAAPKKGKGRCPDCSRLMQPGAAVCSCQASVKPQTFKRATCATTRATGVAEEGFDEKSDEGSESQHSDGSERLTRADADVAMARLQCLTGCEDESDAARSVVRYVLANPGCLTQCAELCADISSHLCARDNVRPEHLPFRSDLLRLCQAHFQDFVCTPTKAGTLILSLMASLYVIGFVGTRTILCITQALKTLCGKVAKNQRKMVTTLLKDMLHRASPVVAERGTPEQIEIVNGLVSAVAK